MGRVLGRLGTAAVGVDSRVGRFAESMFFVMPRNLGVHEDTDDGVAEPRGANATGTVTGFGSTH